MPNVLGDFHGFKEEFDQEAGEDSLRWMVNDVDVTGATFGIERSALSRETLSLILDGDVSWVMTTAEIQVVMSSTLEFELKRLAA